jgi:hypothetical protein
MGSRLVFEYSWHSSLLARMIRISPQLSSASHAHAHCYPQRALKRISLSRSAPIAVSPTSMPECW